MNWLNLFLLSDGMILLFCIFINSFSIMMILLYIFEKNESGLMLFIIVLFERHFNL